MSAAPSRLVAVLRNLLPILGFAGLGLGLALAGLAIYLGADLRHVVLASPWWLLSALVPLLAVLILVAITGAIAAASMEKLRLSRALAGNVIAIDQARQFAGAAEQMPDALLVNPHDISAMADAIQRGLTMPIEERRARWNALIQNVREKDIAWWRRSFIAALEALEKPAA